MCWSDQIPIYAKSIMASRSDLVSLDINSNHVWSICLACMHATCILHISEHSLHMYMYLCACT